MKSYILAAIPKNTILCSTANLGRGLEHKIQKSPESFKII